MENENTKPKNETYIAIQFEGLASTNFDLVIGQQLTPMQLLLVAQYLEILGRRELLGHLDRISHQQEMQKIVVPNSNLEMP